MIVLFFTTLPVAAPPHGDASLAVLSGTLLAATDSAGKSLQSSKLRPSSPSSNNNEVLHLSADVCDAYLADPTHVFARMWGEIGWSSPAMESQRPC